jgi:hypothetical protein
MTVKRGGWGNWLCTRFATLNFEKSLSIYANLSATIPSNYFALSFSHLPEYCKSEILKHISAIRAQCIVIITESDRAFGFRESSNRPPILSTYYYTYSIPKF